MHLPGVRCSVRNCKYNYEGQECSASAIEVNVDQGGDNASDQQETMCQTFTTR